jgi:hypothetical protein
MKIIIKIVIVIEKILKDYICNTWKCADEFKLLNKIT